MKKLLYFVTEDWYFVSHRLTLAVAAKQAGYDVSVVTRVREHGDVIRAAGLRLLPFENDRSGMNVFAELATVRRLISLLKEEQPDIVHNVAMKPVLYGTLAAQMTGVRCVVNAFGGMGWLFTSRNLLANLVRPVVRLLLKYLLKTSITIVQNLDDANILVRMGVSTDRIRHIAGAGVDVHKFYPQVEQAKIPAVVLPARLLRTKGVYEFVSAARLLKKRGVLARFILAGAPDPANPSTVTTDEIDRWVDEGVIEYLGWVVDMATLLANSHIVCLPSYAEGVPKCLIEAAAAARPIVTTDAPGCREIVRAGENGLLVPARAVSPLAEAIEVLLMNAELRREMGRKGRILVEREFDLAFVIDKTLAIYAEFKMSGER